MNGWQMLPNEEGTTTSLWYERIEPDATKWPAPTARLRDVAEGRRGRYMTPQIQSAKSGKLEDKRPGFVNRRKGKSRDEGAATD